MPKRFLLELKYDGTEYCGWQIQNNAVSVQRVVLDALESIIGETFDGIHGCSRTDSGVHADKYFCHFDSNTEISPKNIVLALNTRLPDDISAVSCKQVDESFHARYSCLSKTYKYVINNSLIPDPMTRRYELIYNKKLDIELINSAALYFYGKHDFSAFCSSGSSVSDCTREIYDCKFTLEQGRAVFYISGNGFLYNMVRIIVGTLLYVNEGKLNFDDIPRLICEGDRTLLGPTAPAHGLHLHDVNYGEVKYIG